MIGVQRDSEKSLGQLIMEEIEENKKLMNEEKLFEESQV
jgi:hypothetical protein